MTNDTRIARRDFLAAAATSLGWGLLPPAGRAMASTSAQLKPVAAQIPPGSTDPRLARALGKARGKPVLVNFWATWCPPCREEMPALARLAARWKERGLALMTVAVADNETRVADFLWEVSAELPVLHDRDQSISRAWGTRLLPTTVVLDRRHRMVLRGRGAIDWDAPAIDAQLQALFN